MTTVQKLDEVRFKVKDRWLIDLMLKGLPDEYSLLIMSLESSEIQLSVDQDKAKILSMMKLKILMMDKPWRYL